MENARANLKWPQLEVSWFLVYAWPWQFSSFGSVLIKSFQSPLAHAWHELDTSCACQKRPNQVHTSCLSHFHIFDKMGNFSLKKISPMCKRGQLTSSRFFHSLTLSFCCSKRLQALPKHQAKRRWPSHLFWFDRKFTFALQRLSAWITTLTSLQTLYISCSSSPFTDTRTALEEAPQNFLIFLALQLESSSSILLIQSSFLYSNTFIGAQGSYLEGFLVRFQRHQVNLFFTFAGMLTESEPWFEHELKCFVVCIVFIAGQSLGLMYIWALIQADLVKSCFWFWCLQCVFPVFEIWFLDLCLISEFDSNCMM